MLASAVIAIASLGLSIGVAAIPDASASCTYTSTITIQPPCAVVPCNTCSNSKPKREALPEPAAASVTPIAVGTVTNCLYTTSTTVHGTCPTGCVTLQCAGKHKRAIAPITVTPTGACPTATVIRPIICPLYMCANDAEIVCPLDAVKPRDFHVREVDGTPVTVVTKTTTAVVPSTCTGSMPTVTLSRTCPGCNPCPTYWVTAVSLV